MAARGVAVLRALGDAEQVRRALAQVARALGRDEDSAAAPSFSMQQSKSRKGSTIQREAS